MLLKPKKKKKFLIEEKTSSSYKEEKVVDLDRKIKARKMLARECVCRYSCEK